MIVIADTSPVRYLILLGHAELLPKLYGSVVVPAAVCAELSSDGSPETVRIFCSNRPQWLEIKVLSRPVSSSLLELLDPGESEAIELAEEIGADLLLIDERRGRGVAESRGLDYTGTLGVLRSASDRGWINLSEAVEGLDQANFYFSAELRRRILGEIE
ncbi:MAG TPA: DUF3368 domain-containing protein [Pyrinomonadaceae bacterium]|nr:DUF3368 domain-containing protein [Pyrinomonadaceae bacterium]